MVTGEHGLLMELATSHVVRESKSRHDYVTHLHHEMEVKIVLEKVNGQNHAN